MVHDLLSLAVAALLVLGGLFGLVGSWGLLKLRQPMQRLHAPTKATTAGVGTALLASTFAPVLAGGALTLQEILVAAFLLVTAPLGALFLARLHLHGRTDRAILPPTGTGRDWAVFEPDAE